MITLAAFVIMVCVRAEPCKPLDLPYDTLPECRDAIVDLAATWMQNMDKMLIPAMHCEHKAERT